MTGLEILGIVVVVVLTCLAALLAAAETAFTHLGRAQVDALHREADTDEEPRVGALVDLLESREESLNPVLLLVLFCHLAAAAVVAALVQKHFGGPWVLAGLAVQLVVIFTLAEALPKTWALHDPAGVAMRVAPVVKTLRSIPPLRWVANALIGVSNQLLPKGTRRSGPVMNDDELIAIASFAVEADVIDETEQELIKSVLAFGDTVVREVMVPRPDMVTVRHDANVAEALEISIRTGFSRLPVIAEDIDDVVGIVHAKVLAQAQREDRGGWSVSAIGRAVAFVPETKPVEDLLREMQLGRSHLAVVVDEYGGTAGVVTIEDLLEELVGEIVDEFDHEEPMVQTDGSGSIVVHGRMPVDELEALVGQTTPDGDWDTVGGLIFNSLGHVPDEGETLLVDGLALMVEKMEGRRIRQVRVSIVQSATERVQAAAEAAAGMVGANGHDDGSMETSDDAITEAIGLDSVEQPR